MPLEGATELETLVLHWHGNAQPREALGVQVGLHARRHAVGALETGPSVSQGSHIRPRANPFRTGITRKRLHFYLFFNPLRIISAVSTAIPANTAPSLVVKSR